jgi:hypothetical protein
LPGGSRFLSHRTPDNSLPAPSSAFAARDCAGARAHLDRTGAWPASGCLTCDAGHYCREPVWVLGGTRGSKGFATTARGPMSAAPARAKPAPRLCGRHPPPILRTTASAARSRAEHTALRCRDSCVGGRPRVVRWDGINLRVACVIEPRRILPVRIGTKCALERTANGVQERPASSRDAPAPPSAPFLVPNRPFHSVTGISQ